MILLVEVYGQILGETNLASATFTIKIIVEEAPPPEFAAQEAPVVKNKTSV